MIFINNVKKQCNTLYPNKKFIINYNKKQHQFKNTECGMFSIIYQLRWLNKLYKNKNTNFSEIINSSLLNDKNVNHMRKSLYRPHFKQMN
jgi:hypothetical protein